MVGCFRSSESNDQDRKRDKRFQRSKKILLLGTGESGKTTILKQMKILHINGFSDEERLEKVPAIMQNIHESIHDIVYNMGKITPAVKLSNEENRPSMDYILHLGPHEPSEYSEEYFRNVKTLWSDEGIQEAFQRSNEYQLIESAGQLFGLHNHPFVELPTNFGLDCLKGNAMVALAEIPKLVQKRTNNSFLDRIDEISRPGYIPSTQDILFCRVRTTGITEIQFSIPLLKIHGGSANFLMYDVGGQRGEQKKWIQVFDGIDAILFLIATSDFDLTLREDEAKNRLEEALTIFRNIYCSRFLRDAALIVFLNKQDVLKRKIEQGRQIGKYFPEYQDYQPNERNEYQRAREFMRDKVKSVNLTKVTHEFVPFIPGTSTRAQERVPPRDIYIHDTIATDTKNIEKVFQSVQEKILRNIIDTLKVY